MAAVLARGSLIENAAREPEVADLATCLVRMGARIEGIDSSTMWVQGRDTLHSAEHTVLRDRIETGTYAMVAAITGADVRALQTELRTLAKATAACPILAIKPKSVIRARIS